MERPNFRAARSVFGSTIRKSTLKRPEPTWSSTSTSSSSTPSSWRSRLQNRENGITSSAASSSSTSANGVSSRHQTSSSSSLADDSAPPSKRIGAKLATKSPARPVRKLNISGAKPKEASYRITDEREETTVAKPIYRIKDEGESDTVSNGRKFTSSRSWRPKPKKGEEEEKKDATTTVSRQSSWRKKHVSSQRKMTTDEDGENNTKTPASPQRRVSDEDEDKKEIAPGSLQNSWRKSAEDQGKKVPSYLQNSPKKSPSSVSQRKFSPQRTLSPSKSPSKSPRRRVVFPPETVGTNPLSPVRDNPSPVSFLSPAKRRRSPMRTPKMPAPKLDLSPASPRRAVAASSSSSLPVTETRTHRKNPFKATQQEQRAALRVQTCWRRYRQQVRFLILVKHERKMLKLKKKLASVESEKKRELGEIQRIVNEYKESTKAKAQKKKVAIAEKSVKAAEIEKQTSEMKKENAQIQAKNEMLKKNTRNLRINNLRLEKSAESSKDYYDQLKLHHDRCVEDNQKLSKVEDNYKKKVDELEDNLATRTRYATAEHRIRGLYRQAIRDVVSLAEETNDESVILKLYEIQEEGIEHLEKTWTDPDPLSPTSAERKKKLKIAREKWGDTLKSPRAGRSKGRLTCTYISSELYHIWYRDTDSR